MSAEMNDDSAFRTRLLETFPVTEYELDYLAKFRDFYVDMDSNEFSFYAWLELSSARDTPHLDTVKQIEKTLLPPNFATTLIETAMEQVVTLGCDEQDEELRTFLEAMVTCLGRRGPSAAIDLIPHCCPQQDAYLWIYQLTLASHALFQDEAPEIRGVAKAPDSWMSDTQSFTDWAHHTAPQAYTALSTFVHLALFTRHHAFRPSPLLLPALDKPSTLLDETLAVTIALMSPNLGGAWHRLYSSDADATSFRSMQLALIGYQGPTVLLIRSTCGDVFGFSTDCPWKRTTKWFGEGSYSFLFVLHPTAAIYPSTGQGKHHMYLNLPTRHGALKGLAVGGISSDTPRVLVTESFEECHASSIDKTYAAGPILSDELEAYFDVDILEVWATSQSKQDFETNAEKGQLQAAIHEAARSNAAKVDVRQFVDDLASGTLTNKTFAHRRNTIRCSVRDFKAYFDRPNESQHEKDT